MDNPFWSQGFGPLLAETAAVPFGEIETLERELETKRFAAFFVEPIQGEGGVRVPRPGVPQGGTVLVSQVRHAACA
jgi:acetylornithine/succinyldiaminopimelate/putrescine aminotransferase